ncbi:unnamed protein product [Caenorhabditis angaria]|uniref:Glycosyltransferase family 92 protein n=1 Tax=Caenorhabditis angaria TaxID=860376 RepID=A0A9P1N524_9PELO|nr:unnamed protein product [Caenorhabditis angaria]
MFRIRLKSSVVFFLFLVLIGILHKVDEWKRNFEIVAVCHVEDWNRKTTKKIPNEEIHLQWINMNASRRDNILGSEVRLLNAFVYPDYIAVTTTSQHSYGKLATCQYFDCNKHEIPQSSFRTVFFPSNIVYCARRFGAEYISLKLSEDDADYIREPVPMIYRIFDEPKHEISVCVGPLYGNEPKWLEIIEFVEHYKLMGINHFYFTIFDMNHYSRKILDEYLRTGEIELTVIQTEYEREDWQFHMLQINECHQRAKYHSKWVLNVDIDERLVFAGTKMGNAANLLINVPENIVELSVAIQRVQKTDKIPWKYESEAQLWKEMEFLKYNISAEITWEAFKSFYRPDKSAAMYYHWSYMKYPGYESRRIDENIAYIRHYRTTESQGLGFGWTERYGTFHEIGLEPSFSQKLAKNVIEKVKFVYEQRVLYCDEISREIWKEYLIWNTFNCLNRTL